MAAWPFQKTGSTGEDVRTVQLLLRSHGATIAPDGTFGPQTEAAVRGFQGAHGLVVDGVVGDATWPALIATVAQGADGDAVRAVQSQLHDRIGEPVVDGSFGPVTDSFVRSFQGAAELTADGIVGPLTWHALVVGHLGHHDAPAAGQAVYAAWTHGDEAAARLDAGSAAVAELFTRSWSASDGWSFVGCSGAAGSLYCTWDRPGSSLTIRVNNNAGTPFFYATAVTFA